MRTLGKVAMVPTIASGLIAGGMTAAHASSFNYSRIPYNSAQPAHYVGGGGNIRVGPGVNRAAKGFGSSGSRRAVSHTPGAVESITATRHGHSARTLLTQSRAGPGLRCLPPVTDSQLTSGVWVARPA